MSPTLLEKFRKNEDQLRKIIINTQQHEQLFTVF